MVKYDIFLGKGGAYMKNKTNYIFPDEWEDAKKAYPKQWLSAGKSLNKGSFYMIAWFDGEKDWWYTLNGRS